MLPYPPLPCALPALLHPALAGLLSELLSRPLSAEVAAALNANLLRVLSTPGSSLLVATDEDGALLGFVLLWTRWSLFEQAPAGVVDCLIVARTYQVSKAPHALVEQALGACQAMGCARVEFVPTEASLVPNEELAGFGFARLAERYGLELLAGEAAGQDSVGPSP